MAAKFDQEMMKKHHFWLLLIPLSIGLLLAWIGLFVNVADATEEKFAENEKNKKEIEAAKAQPKKVLELYEAQKGELFELRTKRWLEMWTAQKDVFVWPETVDDSLFARYKEAKFGTEILDPNALSNFQDQFDKAYEAVAAEVAPLQFANGWAAVLRHVAVFARTPKSEEAWLALEDFWVQRELVRGLAKVNTEAAQFTPTAKLAPADPRRPAVVADEPRHRMFTSRTWQVDLRIEDKPGGRVLAGKIKNITPRLQPYNATSQLLLKVWLNNEAGARPFVFVIEGTSLEAGKEEDIKPLGNRHMIFEGRVEEIARVEQVFDARTAPVKRLDRLALGYPSARHAEAELQMSAFSQKAFDAETGDPTTGGATGAGGLGGMPPAPGGLGGPPPGVGGLGGPPPGLGGGPGGLGGAASAEMTVNGLVRRRYIHKTEQVRAMPVGLGLVVDQAYVQDVLAAVANTRLRFQTVQTHMNRFRGNLTYAVSGGSGPGSPDGLSGGPPPGTGSSDATGAGPPPRGGPPPGPGIGSIPGTPPPGGGGPPGFPGPGFGGFFGGSAPRSSNEDQVSGNLVELGVYGILSLYEKFQKEEPKTDAPVGAPPPVGVPPMVPPGKDVPPTEVSPVTPGKDAPVGKEPPVGTPPVTPGKDAPPTDTPPKS